MSKAKLQRNTVIGLGASLMLSVGKCVAGVLGHSSALIADAVESLADTAPALADKVRVTASQVEGVRVIEKLHARKSGRGYLIDVHVHVAPDMDVRAAHALAGKVKAHVREKHSNVQHVLIHIEPDERAKS